MSRQQTNGSALEPTGLDKPGVKGNALWKANSLRVLGSLMPNRPDLVEKILFEKNGSYQDFHPDTHLLFAVIFNELYPVGAAIMPNTVAHVSKQDPKVIENIMWDNGVPDIEFWEAYEFARDWGYRERHIKFLREGINYLQDDKIPIEHTLSQLVRKASMTTMAELGATKFEEVNEVKMKDAQSGEGKTEVTPTGIDWFDSQSVLKGGLRSRRVIAIGGAEKNRKTTLARNLVLGAIRRFHHYKEEYPAWDEDGKRTWHKGNQSFAIMGPEPDVSIAFLAFENDQGITSFDFLAMLAYEYLHLTGFTDVQYGDQPFVDSCDGDTIPLILQDKDWKKTCAPEIVSAIEYANAQAKTIDLHIYDLVPANGQLSSLDDVYHVIKGHKIRHGKDKHVIVVVDCVELVDVRKPLVEVTAQLRTLAKAESITLILLHDDELQSWATHHAFEVIPDDANQLTVTQVSSSVSPSGISHSFQIHPASGLIIDTHTNGNDSHD